MSVEDYIAAEVIGDVPVQTLMGDARPAEEWYFAASALGEGDHPETPDVPYIVWNELATQPFQEVSETSDAQWRVFTLWVYDEEGNFARINEVLNELRRIVKAMAPFTASDGVRCSSARWDGISGNITDQGYHQNVRFGTARFMVSG